MTRSIGAKVSATFIVADVFDGLAQLDDGSVQSVITSPPYWRKRAYLDDDHPDKDREIGQEPSPGQFLASLLRVTDELWRVVRDDGTIWFNLGDTAAGSGGWGGDVDQRDRGGGRRWKGTNRAEVAETPRGKSVCWIPELFGASLAYGRNLLTGEPCRQWITRPPVTWCKPNPNPGAIFDKFREATELFVWAAKEPTYYFDLDSVREPSSGYHRNDETYNRRRYPGQRARATKHTTNPKGVPPKNWWVVNPARTQDTGEAHIAPMPAELVRRPVTVSAPEGGTILDPFAGSGTVGAVATGHNRNFIGIDLDERNADLAQKTIGQSLWHTFQSQRIGDNGQLEDRP